MENKPCRNCNESKPLSEFNKNRQSADRLQSSCRPCQHEYKKEWAKRNRAVIAVHKKKWDRKNPLKKYVHQLLDRAVLSGKVKRLPCSMCGSVKSIGHHEDYSKPYDVIWYCQLHHSARHKELKELKNDN